MVVIDQMTTTQNADCVYYVLSRSTYVIEMLSMYGTLIDDEVNSIAENPSVELFT